MQRVELDVRRFEFDLKNEAHLAEHFARPEDLDAVLYNQPRFFTNLPGREAPYVMIGPDSAGQFFFAAIVPTGEEGVWYPVTAWPMNSRRAMRIYEPR